MLPLAGHTYRECFRRPFPYVAAAAVLLLALGSRLFLVFSFGSAAAETVNLGISAVFLAGFIQAAFQGTTLARADLDRGTLGLLLTKPVDPGSYVIGRYLGLALAATTLCFAVTVGVSALFLLLPPVAAESVVGPKLLLGCGRALFPVLVLDAAALAASVSTSRITAPLALFALFLAGSLLGRLPFLPDFGLFGLESVARPAWAPLLAYTAIYASIFLLLTLIVLRRKQPLGGQK